MSLCISILTLSRSWTRYSFSAIRFRKAISGVLYLTAAWLLLRQRATSFLAFAAALAIALVRWSIVSRIPAYHLALSFPVSNWQPNRIPAAQLVLPLLMTVVLWQMLVRRTFR